MTYRKDIQILRGISVLMVVLYHLEVDGFDSGFLGVDIFFVISGYLMAKLYKPGETREFLLRRAKRLLPAYFATIIAVMLACAALVSPHEFDLLQSQVIWSLAFASNIGFWMENSYFSKSAFNPLLHLWSLGLEIQFYCLFPLLFSLFRRIRGSVSPVILGSLLSCLALVAISPKTAFFWLPFRLWEFLLGSQIAWIGASYLGNKTGSASLMRGFALLVLFLSPFLDVSGQTTSIVWGHPAAASMLVVLATCGVLILGIPRQLESSVFGHALERLGAYSYSIYLTHFPIIVIYLYEPFEGTRLKPQSSIATFAVLTLIVLSSLLMYHLVESGLRGKRNYYRILAAMWITIAVSLPIAVHLKRTVTPPQELLIYDAWRDRSPYRCGKLARIKEPTAISCAIGTRLTNPRLKVMLVGNSHADSIKTEFTTVANSLGASVYFLVQNDPLMPGGLSPEALVAEALKQGTTALVLHYSPKAISPATVRELQKLGEKNNLKISVLLPIPTWEIHIPKALWLHGQNRLPLPKQSALDYQRTTNELRENLQKINGKHFRIYESVDCFTAEDGELLLQDKDARPLYFDSHHLTLSGAKLLHQRFERIVTDLSHEE